MKIDIILGPFVNDPLRAVYLGVLAAKNGFNAIWVTHDPLWENSWMICGAIVSNTMIVEIGPGIVNPYSSSVVEIATGASNVQNLSRGRANLVIGVGFTKMLEERGLSHKDVLKILDVAIDYLRNELNPVTSDLKVKPHQIVLLFNGCQSPKLLERIGKWRVG